MSRNRPRSIYQYSNMAQRLSGQTSIFGVAFFVSKSLLGIERQKKLKKFTIFTRKPRSHVRILIYRTWPIYSDEKSNHLSLSAILESVYPNAATKKPSRDTRKMYVATRYF